LTETRFVEKGLPNQQQITEFLLREFPQNTCSVVSVTSRSATVIQQIGSAHLRPGGTVSGPVLMSVADIALYVAILGTIGLVPLAVTTSMTINFLRRPSPDRPVVGECRLLKTGRVLIVGEVSLYSRGDDQPVAHAVGTYSVPPKKS
jgi:acyl-coenzyme A thioesterase PaaI-like protein